MDLKALCGTHRLKRKGLTKTLRVMKMTATILLTCCLTASATGFSQKITLNAESVPIQKIFKEIWRQSGFQFVYTNQTLQGSRPVTLHVKDAELDEVLNLCFLQQPFTFTKTDDAIIVVKKNMPAPVILPPAVPEAETPPVIISGRIVDDKNNEPLGNVSVMVKGSKRGVNTNAAGEFSISVKSTDNLVLLVTYIGYTDKQVIVKDDKFITIRLTLLEKQLADVEISTGMFKRNKESFTGATSTFTGDQLKSIGNQNIIQSLKSLDPSFIVVENNLQGSNPNTPPKVEVRGKTSITSTDLKSKFGSDPNQPLYILNGFETTQEVIFNLDINRVASVTILKDAASTAIYGSRSANGVVVIETKKPVAGEVRVSYTGDFSLDNTDLKSYNMMNAAEKLEFERLAGMYKSQGYTDPALNGYDLGGDILYNARLADIKRGVNTDWMAVPIQTGFSNGHSLRLSGGSKELTFDAGVSLKNKTGVMKGSDRKTLGGNIDLSYRKGKINIFNSVYVTGYTSNESPYGSFADYVNMNPYLRKPSGDSIPKYIDGSSGAFYTFLGDPRIGGIGSYTVPVVNPLYNASFPNINQTKNFLVQDALQVIWTFSPEIRLQGGFQASKATTTSVTYLAPENTAFDGKTTYEKGSYTNSRQDDINYNGNIMLTYAKLINGDHQLNANLRADITQNSGKVLGFGAVGFPSGSNGNPAFAFGYTPAGTPVSTNTVLRSNSFLASAGYAYKLRYLLDATITESGSSAFGTDNLYKPSWSVGLGWNLAREKFLHVKWIDMLKLRANIGMLGNQNLGTYTSSTVYGTISSSYIFGSGLNITSLGNPGLQWQNTIQKSVGVDLIAMGNRLSATVNYYSKVTDPLIVSATDNFPSSVGLTGEYPVNVGKLTSTGWEAYLRYSPIFIPARRIVWTINASGANTKNTFGNFGHALDEINKEQTANLGLTRYHDGNSPDDIWAVRSMGIDPATGQEIFMKKDGTQTLTYSTDDIVKVGNTRASLEGMLGTTLRYGGFNLGINMRYRLGGKVFNSALFDKVENISVQSIKYNQDKRALYERWQKPGDVKQFRGIQIYQYTPMSSRFVEKDNQLIGESIMIGWDFYSGAWLKKLHMQTVSLKLYTNDLFRLETVKSERGIDYPFANTYSFSINVSF